MRNGAKLSPAPFSLFALNQVEIFQHKSVCFRSNHGTSFYQDKSVSFYRNPRGFVEDHLTSEDDDERVFACRLLTRPCLVLGSNALVKTFLEECVGGGKTYNGLKDFFFGLFGNSILFSTDPSEVDHLR